ncbi:MAG: flagellar hook-associated protein FlgK [Oscillospiraceae bacterium]|nr:flagellar hook-associated protein FlgK [Oscillospiraceae bacterium]
MMRSTFFGLEIGRTGLTTAQFGLDVTGHNIANVDTDGFTRQRIVSTANDPFATIGKFAPTGQGQVGGGVRVQILDQIRSAYLDRRFRTESTTNAYWQTRTQSLSYIESFFDNVNEKTSINYSMAEFFRSMTIVSQDPVSGAPRTLMQTAAMDLVKQLNMIYEGLIDFQKVEDKAVETKTGDINRIAQDIVELNKAIYGFEITGMIANDLRDKRNLLIDELATYVDIEYEEYPDKFGHSQMRIRIGGDVLVDHDRSHELIVGWVSNVLDGEERVAMPMWADKITVEKPDDPDDAAAWARYEAAVFEASLNFAKITGGELRAHMDMRDGIGGGVDSTNRGIPYYIEMVNNLARALVQEINSQHVQGWSDHPDGSRTGILFFDDGVDPGTGVAVFENPDGTGDRIGTRFGSVIFYHDGNITPPGSPNDPSFDWDNITGTEYSLTETQLKSITARNLNLSAAIIATPFNIAASDTRIGRAGEDDSESENLQRGNNKNMLKLYDLFRKTDVRIMIDGQYRDIGGFDDYGTVIRFDVGNTLHTAKQAAETSRILTLAANNQRTAIAGVSLDEEMVGLVKYNHAYNGAARVITAMDDALDRLINGTGRVGL